MSQSTNPFCICGDTVDARCPVHVGVFDDATRYDSDADGFTRGTIPADERIASRKLAQGSTNPKDDTLEILADKLYLHRITEVEFLNRLEEYVTLARIDELERLQRVAWRDISYSAEIYDRIAALQRDSQPGGSDG